ncbi:MAG: hypothetical protein B7733_09100 [Myxococcales bacterium FL481]|nr:MAG: hypothetical protein B7733_09100 [Myxococcales bacterium FL481]
MNDPAPGPLPLRSACSVPSGQEAVARVREQIVDMFGDIASFWGFTRTQGRVYGLVFLSSTPVDHATVRDALSISAGSTSMTLASLTEWGALRRTQRTYTAQTNLWKLITGIMRQRETPKITAATRRLHELANELQAAGPSHEVEFMRARLDHLSRFFDGCRAFLDALVEQNPVHGILNRIVRRAARFERSL